MTSMRGFSLSLLLLVTSCAGPPPSTEVTSADGLRIEYDVFGSEGPAVVLVHGWANDRTYWYPHTSALSQSHRVVTVDLGGFGDSGTDRAGWTMASFGQDVLAVVNALELDAAVLVGFSMGGAAVLEAAAQQSDRIGGVILVDVFHNVDPAADEGFSEVWMSQVAEGWYVPEVMGAFIGTNPHDSLVGMLMERIPPEIPDRWWDSVREFFRWSNSDLPRALQAIDLPIVAINAEQPPTDVEGLRVYDPDFDALTIPGVGHLGVLWMKPDLFRRHLTVAVKSMVGGG